MKITPMLNKEELFKLIRKDKNSLLREIQLANYNITINSLSKDEALKHFYRDKLSKLIKLYNENYLNIIN